LNEQRRSNLPPLPSVDENLRQWLDVCREFGMDELYFAGQELPQMASETPTVGAEESVQLENLRRLELGECIRCKLHSGRKTIVFGEGNSCAELMLVGEAPGAEEDTQGRPFVGRAGQLLMQMIRAISFERENVYIANVLKCRPPNNRPPEPDEVQMCSPFLWKQISIIKPKVILALGVHAAQMLISSKSSIGLLRNRVYEMPFGKVIATYHPSFLLRSPQMKPAAWEDLKLVRKTLDEMSQSS
jgi:uracil-DNA glycosylase